MYIKFQKFNIRKFNVQIPNIVYILFELVFLKKNQTNTQISIQVL